MHEENPNRDASLGTGDDWAWEIVQRWGGRIQSDYIAPTGRRMKSKLDSSPLPITPRAIGVYLFYLLLGCFTLIAIWVTLLICVSMTSQGIPVVLEFIRTVGLLVLGVLALRVLWDINRKLSENNRESSRRISEANETQSERVAAVSADVSPAIAGTPSEPEKRPSARPKSTRNPAKRTPQKK